MTNLNKVYLEFTENFKIVLEYILENFGDKDILLRKNKGLIPSRNFEIKNSQVKGYVFHGYGCDFNLKKNSIDIEFDDDYIGFTDWSFYTYSKKIDSQITVPKIREYLTEKVESGHLNYTGLIYIITGNDG